MTRLASKLNPNSPEAKENRAAYRPHQERIEKVAAAIITGGSEGARSCAPLQTRP